MPRLGAKWRRCADESRFKGANALELHSIARETQIRGDPATGDVTICDSDVRFHRALGDVTGSALLSFVMFTAIEALQPAANLLVLRFRAQSRSQDRLSIYREGYAQALALLKSETQCRADPPAV